MRSRRTARSLSSTTGNRIKELTVDLRPELLPPVITPERLAELRVDIERIADLVLHGERGKAADAVAAFNAATGHSYSEIDFAEYSGWRNLDDFAMEAARPAWPKVLDITPEEFAEIVRRIQAAGSDTEYYLRLVEVNCVDPNASSLIFHPPAHLENASAEEIVSAALAYRSIAL